MTDESITPPENLRARIFDRTLVELKRHKKRRLFVRGGQLSAVYAAGIVTVLLLQNALFSGTMGNSTPLAHNEAMSVSEEIEADVPTVGKGNGSKTEKVPASRPLEEEQNPWLLRQRVLNSPREEKIALLKKAGDLYLAQRNVSEAVNCYSQIFELRPNENQVKPEDSWLFAELKSSRTRQLASH